MYSNIFFVGDTHVDEEFFDLFSVVSLHYQNLILIFVIGLFLFLSAFLFGLLAFFGDSAVGLEVLHECMLTFFQNLRIFL